MNELKLKPVPGKGVTVSKTNQSPSDAPSSKPPVSGSKPSGIAGVKLMKSAALNKPSTASKVSRISNLMKQFEKNEEGGGGGGGDGGSGGSADSSTGSSPSHMMPRPPPPALDVSPMTGRKMDRKNSVNDGITRFGGRSPSPDVKPYLPPKSGTHGGLYGLSHDEILVLLHSSIIILELNFPSL